MEAQTPLPQHATQLPVVPYRTSQEIEEWKRERDPLHNFRRRLVTEGVLGEADAAGIEAMVSQEIDEAVTFARQSPYPEPCEAFDDLFARPIPLRHS